MQRLVKSHGFRILALFACTLVQVSPVVAQGGTNFAHFTLSIVKRTGDTVEGHTLSYLGSPVINNKGLIVFTARFSDIPAPECLGVTATALCTSGILTPTHLLAKTGDAIGGQTLTWISDPVSVNDSGTVAFAAGIRRLDTGAMLGQRAIFTQHALVAKPGDSIDGCKISQIGASKRVLLDPRPAIDRLGNVFFSANYFSPCLGRSVGSHLFTQHHIVHVGQRPIGYFDVSSAGTVGVLTDLGIYDRSGAIVQYGALIDGQRVDGIGPPAVNDAGRVVFAGQFSCSPKGCSDFLASRSRVIARSGDVIGGLRVSEFWTPMLNNKDVVAFRALVGPDNLNFLLFSTELGVIAKPGDVIAGRTLRTVGRNVLADYASMNDDGRVVFLGTFTDGSQAIILATP